MRNTSFNSFGSLLDELRYKALFPWYPTQNDASQATALFSMNKFSTASDALGLRFAFAETTFSSRSVTGDGIQQALMRFLS